MNNSTAILISCLHTNTPLSLALGQYLEADHSRRVHFISDDCPSSHLLPDGSLVLTKKSYYQHDFDEILPDEVHILFDRIYTRDRFLNKRMGKNEAIKMLRHWSGLIRDFLNNYHIGIIVLEGTPAYELLLEYWGRKAEARIVCPAQIVWGTKSCGVLYSESTWTNSYIVRHSEDVPKSPPDFKKLDTIFDCNDSRPRLWRRLRNFFSTRSINSPTRRAQLVETARMMLSDLYLSLFNDNHRLERLQGDIVTYFLHVDPEKSVDNSGSDVWPQMAVINDLRARLPRTTTLVVRDHPLINGKRLMRDAYAIRNLPQTLYVTGRSDRFSLIKQSRFVTTISGSVALEAAMLGASVIVYGRPLFLYHPYVKHVETVSNFESFGGHHDKYKEANAVFARYIELRMAKFVFGDIYLMSTAMTNNNISNLANAILDAERNGWKV